MTVVDVHAHVMLPEVDDMVRDHPDGAAERAAMVATMGMPSLEQNRRLLGESWRHRLTDVDERLRHMDAAGIDVHVLSVSPLQYNYWADPALAARLCTAVNQRIAAMCAEHPDRFAGLAHLPLQHPELAVAMLTETMGNPAFRGVEISTSIDGVDISDARYEPFWAKVSETGAVVFIHPWGCSLGARLSGHYLGNVIGQPIETTVALSQLIFGGHLDRHPGLRICAAHGGGYLPMYIGRSDHAWDVRPESHSTPRAPSEYLRRIWFDSVVHAPRQVRWLIEAVGADRVVLGTDYPFDMGDEDPLAFLRSVPAITDSELAAVSGDNAVELFSIRQARSAVG
jgi:aminocarboxymuconate-semialdehyde decarboxylase